MSPSGASALFFSRLDTVFPSKLLVFSNFFASQKPALVDSDVFEV